MPPKFFSCEIITKNPERAEITHHPLPIGRWTGCSRTALRAVEHLQFVGLHASSPQQSAIFSLITARLKLPVREGCQEQFIVPRARRRWGPGNRDFPQ